MWRRSEGSNRETLSERAPEDGSREVDLHQLLEARISQHHRRCCLGQQCATDVDRCIAVERCGRFACEEIVGYVALDTGDSPKDRKGQSSQLVTTITDLGSKCMDVPPPCAANGLQQLLHLLTHSRAPGT
jgi:hypothetical protein